MFQCQHWVCIFKNAIETHAKNQLSMFLGCYFIVLKKVLSAVVLNKTFQLIYQNIFSASFLSGQAEFKQTPSKGRGQKHVFDLKSVKVWLRPATKASRGRPSPRQGVEENGKKQAETGGLG